MRKMQLSLLFLAAICFAGPPARAEPIGAAVAVERDVTHAGAGAAVKLAEGDRLSQEEVVTTQKASSAKLKFLDDTQLFIGPASTVKLDRFVYNPDKSVQALSLDLVRGGFRFVTGKSDHKAYVITTPEATIGVRGTVIGIFITRGKTLVKLKEGGVTVCLRRAARSQCAAMEQLESTVEVTATRISEAGLRRDRGPDFSIWCSAGKATCGLPALTPAPK